MHKIPHLLITFLLLVVSTLQAATFKNSPTVCTLAGKNALGHTRWYFSIIRASDNQWMAAANYSPAGANTADSVTLTVPTHTTTYDFYIVAWSGVTANNASQMALGKKWEWISAYEEGSAEPQESANGPYDISGNPTYDDGSPADPATANPPDNSFEASIQVACPTTAAEGKKFKITAKNSDNVLIHTEIVTVAIGETRTVTVTADESFTLTAQEVIELSSFDPELTPGGPDDENRYSPIGAATTVNSQGGTDPPPPQPQATNQATAQSNPASAPQAAAQKNTISQATTGATSKDMSDVANNISNEIARATDQIKASGDAMVGEQKRTNDTLNNFLKSGKIRDSGGSGADGATDQGALEAAQGFAQKVTTIKDSLDTLINKVSQPTGGIGSGQLTWQFQILNWSPTVTLEPFADHIAFVRAVLLWVMSLFFAIDYIKVIRSAFAG